MTDKGHLTTRHRSMIKSVPNVNNEATNIPDIVDDSKLTSRQTFGHEGTGYVQRQQPFMKLVT